MAPLLSNYCFYLSNIIGIAFKDSILINSLPKELGMPDDPRNFDPFPKWAYQRKTNRVHLRRHYFLKSRSPLALLRSSTNFLRERAKTQLPWLLTIRAISLS